MKKKVLVIMDREEKYAKRLMEAFNGRNRMGFQAEMFTDADAFCCYAAVNKVDVLLVGETMMREELAGYAVLVVVLSEGERVAETDEHPVIYKYQSSERILRKVLESYADYAELEDIAARDGMEVYGIYAPQGRYAKSQFAWNLARWLGRRKSVLYVNLTAFMGRPETYMGEKELADLMYYVRHGFENLIYLIGSMVTAIDGIDCLPAMRSVEDLSLVSGEDWARLLRTICEKSSYDCIVINIEECIHQYYRLLGMCHTVLFPYMEGAYREDVWSLCEQYFIRMGAEEIWKKGKRLQLEKNFWRNDMENILKI